MDGDNKELIEFLDKKFNKIEERFDGVEKDISEFKTEMTGFKNEMLSFEDKALKDLEDLKQEKTMGDAQDKRKTKVLEIHNDVLKSNKILTDKQASEIDALGAF